MEGNPFCVSYCFSQNGSINMLCITADIGSVMSQVHPSNSMLLPTFLLTLESSSLHNEITLFLILCQQLTFRIYISAFTMEIVI